MPVFLRIGAVDFGDEVTDEGFLIERREIRAQEVVSRSEKAVVVHLEKEETQTIGFFIGLKQTDRDEITDIYRNQK